ncbi:hypothetical protein SLA2020_339500 [Shorea laevis]
MGLFVGFVAVLADPHSVCVGGHRRPTFTILLEGLKCLSDFVPPSPANLCRLKLLILDWRRFHEGGLYVGEEAQRFNLEFISREILAF